MALYLAPGHLIRLFYTECAMLRLANTGIFRLQPRGQLRIR